MCVGVLALLDSLVGRSAAVVFTT